MYPVWITRDFYIPFITKINWNCKRAPGPENIHFEKVHICVCLIYIFIWLGMSECIKTFKGQYYKKYLKIISWSFKWLYRTSFLYPCSNYFSHKSGKKWLGLDNRIPQPTLGLAETPCFSQKVILQSREQGLYGMR